MVQTEQQIIFPASLSRPGRKKIWLGILVAGLVACGSHRPAAPPPAPPANAENSPPLHVALLWTERVDLDLYVTDPSQETVYFANPRSGSGGDLEHDVACGALGATQAAAAMSEDVVWKYPPPGRYRVGVDFMDACDTKAKEVTFRLVVDVGGKRQERVGKVTKNRFDPVVMEFDLPG